MAKKQVLYIQFQIGEVARIEQEAVRRTAGDIAKFHFVAPQTLDLEKLDLLHDYDQVVLGSAPLDYPQECPTVVNKLVKEIVKLKFPCLGIDYGHLVLANEFGYQIRQSAENAELNQIVEFEVHQPQADITPNFGIDLSENGNGRSELKFWAYTNHYQSVVGGERHKVLMSSDRSYYAGIELSKKIFGVQFIPFLDEKTYRWWLYPYTDFWFDILGFWKYRRSRYNTAFDKVYLWLQTKLKRLSRTAHMEAKVAEKVKETWKDLSHSRMVLRNFILNVHKS